MVSVGDISPTDHCLTVSFSSTSSNYYFSITNVYALADPPRLGLIHGGVRVHRPPQTTNWVAIGNFNLTRLPTDKNTANFNFPLASRFNNLIDGLSLLDFPLLDRLYTWSNKRETPTLARLDRAFFRNAFAAAFSNASLSSRLGNTSNHIHLILNIIPTSIPKSHRFSVRERLA